MLAVVDPCRYPVPLSRTFTDAICPLETTGHSTAPIPSPSIVISGVELYPDPAFNTRTSATFPLLTTTSSCAFLPVTNSTFGCLSKLITSDEPYPTPFEFR